MKKWGCVFNNRLLQIFIHIYFVTIKNNQVSLVSRLEIQQTLSFISYLHRMFLDRTKELKTDTFVWLIPVSHTQAHMRRHSGCQLHFQCNSIDHGLEVAKFCTVKLEFWNNWREKPQNWNQNSKLQMISRFLRACDWIILNDNKIKVFKIHFFKILLNQS